MPLTLINNQPLRFSNTKETDSDCVTERNTYCQLYQTGDRIMAQWMQTPCDDTNLVCNPDLTNAASEILLDNSFTAAGFGSGWDSIPVGIHPGAVYDTVNDLVDFAGVVTNTAIGQNPDPLTAATNYIVTITISNSTQGGVQIVCGDDTYNFYGDGNHTVILNSGANVYFQLIGIDDFDGRIENASCKELDYTCTVHDPTYWEIIDGQATHITGNTATFALDLDVTPASGEMYEIKFTVSGQTAGDLSFEFAGEQNAATVTADGNYSFFAGSGGIFTGNQLIFQPSTDFDGAISAFEVIKYETDYVVELVDSDTLVTEANLTAYVSYNRNYIILNAPTIAINEGCYRITITDGCYGGVYTSSYDYVSNCLVINDSIPCSKYIFAYNSEDGFGFTFFNDGIRQQGLGARLRCLFKNPRYDGQNERYLGSDGTYRKSFASTEKKWDLKFDYVDEWTHDYIRVMLQCDHLQIGDQPYSGEYYSCVDDDYTPEWVDEITNIAQSTVEVQRAASVLFNNNAGF